MELKKSKQRAKKKKDLSIVINSLEVSDASPLAHLNAEQKAGVTHQSGPLLVIAGAGTGKTRVITERIAHIIRSGWAKNDEVLALTFTEKATAEIEERVDQIMPLGYEAIAIHTFHGFCDRILREFGMDIGISPNFRILQGVAHWLFLKEHLFEFDLDYYRPLGNPTSFIDALLRTFSSFKEELNFPQDVLELAEKKQAAAKSDEEVLEAKRLMELANAYFCYQQLLIENNVLDFSDLQSKTLELFEKRPNILKALQDRYKYILVDEYQDTNIAQNTIVNLLVATHQNLMVVGDDDQSIYKFRGAAISNILQFEENYPEAKKIVLTQNYRSNQRILDLAYASIQGNNPDRLEVKSAIDKKLVGQCPGVDESIHVVHSSTIEQEVDYVLEEIGKAQVPLSEIAILCRANAHAEPYIQALKKAGIPYSFVSERGLYFKPEVQDLIAVLRVLANPTDDISFFQVIRMPVWKISMETIVFLIQNAKKSYRTLWQQVKDHPDCKLLSSTLKDALEYSKSHTVGETLYRLTMGIGLYESLLSKNSLEAEEQIVNIATFFNKIRTFERDNEHISVMDFVAYLDLAQEAGENPAAKFELEDREAVFVSTVHGAKGLEFNTVFLPSMVNGRFPSMNRKDPIKIPDELVHEILSGDDTHMQEERRLFYVAVTRAKENLHLLHSDFYAPSAAKNPRKKKRSRFIDEIDGQVDLMHVEKTVEGVEKFLKPRRDVQVAPPVERPKITRFSYSQLTQFKNCPRQYHYNYVLKIPQPPNANFSFGSTMHNTLQEFYTAVRQHKQASLFAEFEPDMSLERLLSIYEDKWIDRGYESKQHMELRKARGAEILTEFHAVFNQNVPQVRFLEKGFKLKVGDYTLSGRIDRADDLPDGTLEIIDYKSGRPKSEKQVKNDLQLFIYALAAQECFGLSASRLTLYFLDGNEAVTVEPNEAKMEKVKTEIVEIGDRINQSNFEPTPDKFKCKHCPFNRICDAAVG